MNSLSLALSIEWDDCTVALAGEDLSGAAIPEIALGARERLGVQGGAQASRDALTLVRQALAQAGQPLIGRRVWYASLPETWIFCRYCGCAESWWSDRKISALA